MMRGEWVLYGQPGWGSALVELQLAWYGLPYRFQAVGHLFKDAAARAALQQINPLGQIPTLILPDGQVMTESAAITLLLADQCGDADRSLVPPAGHPQRAAFLRWLLFVTSAVYPCYTFYDSAAQFVADPTAQPAYAQAVKARLQEMYRLWDGAVTGPQALGDRLTALDVYAAVMTQWEPGEDWFRAETPRLWAVAEAARRVPDYAAAWQRNDAALIGAAAVDNAP